MPLSILLLQSDAQRTLEMPLSSLMLQLDPKEPWKCTRTGCFLRRRNRKNLPQVVGNRDLCPKWPTLTLTVKPSVLDSLFLQSDAQRTWKCAQKESFLRLSELNQSCSILDLLDNGIQASLFIHSDVQRILEICTNGIFPLSKQTHPHELGNRVCSHWTYIDHRIDSLSQSWYICKLMIGEVLL